MAKYKITTPEQVTFHYEIAGIASRAMAWTIDQLLLWALRISLIMIFYTPGVYMGFVFIFLGIFALDFGYYILFELYWSGQSPGKRFYGLRVVSSRGGRLRFPEVFIRNVLRPVDTIPIAMTLGGAVAFIDPLRRRLGDIAAETLVVRDSRVTLPENALENRNRANTFETDTAVKNRILARVTREERDLLLDLTTRRDELEPEVRAEMFRDAASYFGKRYGLPENLEYLSDEQVVINIALVIMSAVFT